MQFTIFQHTPPKSFSNSASSIREKTAPKTNGSTSTMAFHTCKFTTPIYKVKIYPSVMKEQKRKENAGGASRYSNTTTRLFSFLLVAIDFARNGHV